MITAQNLHIKIGDRTILHNLNFTIETGKITAILGSNGVGKSTLLKTLTGALTAQSGTILIDQTNIEHLSLEDLAKKRSVLSQQLHIDFPFRVYDIVAMGLYNNHHNQRTHDDIIDQTLTLIDAQDLKYQLFNQLSGGQQQRVNIARVLAQIWQQENCYLFLDEPTSALDLKYQHILLKLIQNMTTQLNLTSCIVIHDMHLAYRYADNIMLLKDGHIFAHGPTQQTYTADNIAHIFDLDHDDIACLFTKQNTCK